MSMFYKRIIKDEPSYHLKKVLDLINMKFNNIIKWNKNVEKFSF